MFDEFLNTLFGNFYCDPAHVALSTKALNSLEHDATCPQVSQPILHL